jgi:4-diphosphocytidyl-2-C-methyl-D-erythritol kinase
LGGGSSDAAAALVCLNHLWGLDLGRSELAALALELGSDVPFFLGNGPAWCTGRGEIMTPVEPAYRFNLVVVKPMEGLCTRKIFQLLGAGNLPGAVGEFTDPKLKDDQAFQNALRQTAMALGNTLRNDLEVPSCQLLPSLEQIRKEMMSAGVLGVVMTGSGSAMVALAADASKAVSVAQRLKSARTPTGPVAVYVACSAVG